MAISFRHQHPTLIFFKVAEKVPDTLNRWSVYWAGVSVTGQVFKMLRAFNRNANVCSAE